MRIFLKLLICGLLCIFFETSAFATERLFYMLRIHPNQPASMDTFRILKRNYQLVDIVVPQAYQVNYKGEVKGNVDTGLLKFLAQKHIKLMPLVTNEGFDMDKTHIFLHDPIAQAKAIASLVNECEKYHYYGLQIDFESINVVDQQYLTNFYQSLAAVMHKNGFAISIAIAPRATPDDEHASAFLQRRYEVLSGVYDYKALAEVSDFVTLMAYDEHWGATTPGPVAAYPWVENIIIYALKYIPAQKISLGIPVYSDYWFTGKLIEDRGVIKSIMEQLSHQQLQNLLDKYNLTLQWDPTTKTPFSIFNYQTLNEYIFAENAQSFAAKLELVIKYNLRGIAVWRIGMEDPAIWQVLKEIQ